MAPGVETDSLETGDHDLPVSGELESYLLHGWGDAAAAGVHVVAPPAHCAERRRRLQEALPGERIVVPAGRAVRRGNGQEVRYRAASDHVYLTGYQAEGAVLVLDPGDDATLYLEPPSSRDGLAFYNDAARGELWVGARPSLDEVGAALGLRVRPLSELDETAPARVVRDAPDSFADRELLAVLSELRLVKDDWEVEQIEQAVRATIAGFEDVGRALAGETDERSVETIFAARARRDGNDVAFNPIAAGGPHATTLHWTRNDAPLRAGELLLLDAGVESHTLYAADLTRTYPVSGRFTDVQRRALELLNDAQDAALAAIAPGRPFRDFRHAIAAVLGEGLGELGISTDGPDDLYRRFTICGPGHMLGLDVHDCAHARARTYLDGTLEAGHVLTVEPGLYFQANDLTIPEELRGIGFRVEDDVVVTGAGIRNLSEDLPRRATEIEEWLDGLRP